MHFVVETSAMLASVVEQEVNGVGHQLDVTQLLGGDVGDEV